jgi:hypothetical protein
MQSPTTLITRDLPKTCSVMSGISYDCTLGNLAGNKEMRSEAREGGLQVVIHSGRITVNRPAPDTAMDSYGSMVSL